jgi:hypothetical protein
VLCFKREFPQVSCLKTSSKSLISLGNFASHDALQAMLISCYSARKWGIVSKKGAIWWLKTRSLLWGKRSFFNLRVCAVITTGNQAGSFVVTSKGLRPSVLDAKGRLSVPTRHRDVLERDCGWAADDHASHPHGCLMIFPRTEWEKFR